jgi:hypothetical protein
MNPKLSIILPGIRKDNWLKFYESVVDSFDGTFEVVIVSPYDRLPEELRDLKNIVHIKDLGAPARCQQIALVNCTGEFVTWGADDGYFLPNKLTEAVKYWEENAASPIDIVTCKYFEGEKNQQGVLHSTGETELSQDFYYKLNNAAGLRSAFIPDDYWILNVGILKTAYAKALGGWDSMFEVTAVSHADFAVRTQRNGSKYHMLPEPIFACTHMPGTTGDHAPVHYGHIQHDEPLFRKIYQSAQGISRTKIDINNWQQSPPVWRRRYGDV